MRVYSLATFVFFQGAPALTEPEVYFHTSRGIRSSFPPRGEGRRG